MKNVAVRSKDMDIRCWSPKLYIGLCDECNNRNRCKISNREREEIRKKVRRRN